jgi:hypothetical protein
MGYERAPHSFVENDVIQSFYQGGQLGPSPYRDRHQGVQIAHHAARYECDDEKEQTSSCRGLPNAAEKDDKKGNDDQKIKHEIGCGRVYSPDQANEADRKCFCELQPAIL